MVSKSDSCSFGGETINGSQKLSRTHTWYTTHAACLSGVFVEKQKNWNTAGRLLLLHNNGLAIEHSNNNFVWRFTRIRYQRGIRLGFVKKKAEFFEG